MSENLPVPGKPLLRGWLHVGAAPIVLIAGLALVVFAPTLAGRASTAIFTLTAVMMFGTSAVYHRGDWSPRALAVLRRMDHANIFLIIAGTYTPLTVMLLEGNTRTLVLVLVWSGAIVGTLLRVFWLGAPRWAYVPLYLALGWVAVGFIGPFYSAGGATVVGLIIAGGVAYTAGAVIYGTKWPRGSTRYFGFHEIFHALTIAGFTCTYIAVALVIFTVSQ
ncbi:PAQR family membrane homeostasis protein TrhA [Demequina muriae]|uniref:Hemolysin III family protein n=1 Tax=Demequina muriae TaxID=3051664 RepID=A0ABT8GF33_9MICO|nr:hemolysin III family protein [Demequina sp. EGI L300058]MDN4480044.1 hemolysin III family protein [Demequina sp. EGI L300058]